MELGAIGELVGGVAVIGEIDRRLVATDSLPAIHEGFPWLGVEATGQEV